MELHTCNCNAPIFDGEWNSDVGTYTCAFCGGLPDGYGQAYPLARSSGERRRYLTRGFEYESENEVMQAARGWLLDGWAVRIVRAQDGTFTLESWEV